eukprot:COSAG02_NODE_2346_length_9092_cov_6.591460_3_plen_81_part_00
MADGEVGLTTGDGDGTKPQVGGLVEAVRKGVSTSHLDSRHSICMFREEGANAIFAAPSMLRCSRGNSCRGAVRLLTIPEQ